MKARRSSQFAVLEITACLALSGCGGTLYAIEVNGAASKVAQAKELGAEKLAPFEYFYASEHLTKAMSEAAEGDYSDAIDFASTASEYADKAIALSHAAHAGAGR